MMHNQSNIPEFHRRYGYLMICVIGAFAILAIRLFQLQVARNASLGRQARENYLHHRRISTIRGIIRDRHGKALVVNRPSFDVFVVASRATPNSVVEFARYMSLDGDRLARFKRRLRTARRLQHQSTLAVRDITRNQLAVLETYRQRFPGFHVVAQTRRHYPYGHLAAHVVGYMNEVTNEDLKRKNSGYRVGDLVGRYGIERMYEAELRGRTGKEVVALDAHGNKCENFLGSAFHDAQTKVAAVAGHDIDLTIDIDLQDLVWRSLKKFESGAAVILEVNTGRILASVSNPSFDPNKMMGRLTVAEAKRLIEDPNRPLLDKVVRESYFPGSVYKVVTAAAALEAGVTNWYKRVKCKGAYRFGGRFFRCSHTHGSTHLHQAIMESCNIYFYALAEQLGMDRMADFAHRFGLGSTTGVGINGEVGGLIPTKAWYRRKEQRFRLGHTLNASIGQGNVRVTVLQIANLYAAIANGGNLLYPSVVQTVKTSDGTTVFSFKPRSRGHLPVSKGTLRRLQLSLEAVVHDRDGTAWESRLSSVRVAGKTGTAQVVRRGAKKDRRQNDHSWFAAYAPAEKAEIAVAVLIENGGRAAKVATPVAMKIIKEYFRRKRQTQAATVAMAQ